MGKYNFDMNRVIEVENRLKELEARSARLEHENGELKKQLAAKPTYERNLVLQVKNYDKIKELFGFFAAKDGKLKATDNRTQIGNNFTTFYTNVLRVLKPYVRKNDSNSSTYRIVSTPQKEFDDKEWGIAVETVEAVVDTIYYAKKKMTEERKSQ